MKKLLSIIFVSLLLSGSANATMKGIPEMELMVENLGNYAKECSVTEQKIETAVKYILQNSKIKLKDHPYNPTLYVKLVVIKAGGVCTSHLDISVFSYFAKDPLELENSGTFVFYQDSHMTSGGSLSDFSNSVVSAIEEMMKKLVVKHHEDNK
jgi:hypothetical protein